MQRATAWLRGLPALETGTLGSVRFAEVIPAPGAITANVVTAVLLCAMFPARIHYNAHAERLREKVTAKRAALASSCSTPRPRECASLRHARGARAHTGRRPRAAVALAPIAVTGEGGETHGGTPPAPSAGLQP